MHRHPVLNLNLILLTLLTVSPLAAETPPAKQDKSTLTPGTSTQSSEKHSLSDPLPILAQWSAASSFLSPVGPQSAVEKFKKQNQAYFSGHELTIISEFQQPVSAQTLQSEYKWRVVRSSESSIILRGTPSDPLTRHLCRTFELQINTRSMLPESLTFLPGKTQAQSRFAAVELSALKEVRKSAVIAAPPEPEFVSQTVAKAIFPQADVPAMPVKESPIRRVSFSQSSSDNRNETELLEIEKLVERWITVSHRVDSVRLANGITLFPQTEQQKLQATQSLSANTELSPREIYLSAMQNLSMWLMNVDQSAFVIDSFSIELSTDEPGPVSAKFITLKLKPAPDQPQPAWQSVEMEFHSSRSLPVKISETRNHRVVQFLLSGLEVNYTE